MDFCLNKNYWNDKHISRNFMPKLFYLNKITKNTNSLGFNRQDEYYVILDCQVTKFSDILNQY